MCGYLNAAVPLVVPIFVLLVRTRVAHAPMSREVFFVSGRLPDTDAVDGIGLRRLGLELARIVRYTKKRSHKGKEPCPLNFDPHKRLLEAKTCEVF